MSMAKDWARNGSAIFLDPKGELFKYTARNFRRVYRLDLADPRMSDRWNFVPACRGDAELSHEIASIVVGFDFKMISIGESGICYFSVELRRITRRKCGSCDAPGGLHGLSGPNMRRRSVKGGARRRPLWKCCLLS
jgi:hypothetical protein